MKTTIITITRLLMVIAVFTAVTAQLILALSSPTFSIVNFFSFFTIESNLFAATVLLISAYVGWKGTPSPRLEYFRGAATMYMIIVGVIYFLLLRGFENSLNTPVPWVNFILHYLFPVVIAIDWIISPLAHTLRFKKALLWLIFPFAYLVYSMIRGGIVGWYPYPFLNPANGLGWVAIAAGGIALLSLSLAWFLTRKPAVKNS